ncbi:MAG: chitinase N-terminal domain-containing protein [Gammaproteobacteria bacterium]
MSVRILGVLSLVPVLLALSGCGEEVASLPVAVPEVAAAPTVRDGSLMAPGRPQLARLPDMVPVAAPQAVTWNMWWGENGREWKLYVNGKLADSGTVASRSPKAQQATAELMLAEAGSAEIKVALCNDHGCTESAPVVIMVANG